MLKKVLYGCAIAALTISCNEKFDDWATPQGYEPEEAPEVELTTSDNEKSINLGEVEADTIQLMSVGLDMPEGYVLDSYVAKLYAKGESEDDSTQVLIADVPVTDDGRVAIADLQSIVGNYYGLRPTARDVILKAYAKVFTSAKKEVCLKSNTISIELSLTPQAPVIEQAYYLTGTLNGWDNTNTDYKLTNDGSDPYENPVFKLRFAAPADGSDVEFKMTPESGLGGDWSGCLAAGTEEGKFNYNNEGGNFVIKANPDALYYELTFNMLDQTWGVTPIGFNEFIYEIGGESGWATNHALAGNGFGQYVGFYYLNSEFKFKPNEDNWDGDYEKVEGTAYEGTLSEQGAGNVDAPEAGFYKIDVDLAAMTYKLTAITAIGIIGNGGDWNNDIDMTYNAEGGYWEVYTDLAAGEFKFRANHDWAINWGGTFDDLQQDGANLNVATAGKYFVRLFLGCPGKQRCSISSFSENIYEIGGESGWSTSHLLLGNGNGQYQGIYYLNGEFKFKPNADNWDGDYEKVEGTAYEGTLSEQGAGNIDAPEAGVYVINVDLAAMTYKLTALTAVGIIGNGGDWSNDIDMTYNVEAGCFEVTTELAVGEFKFRANHDWAINWGGSFDNLSQDGANLSVAEAGTYKVQLFLSYAGKHYCTVNKQ